MGLPGFIQAALAYFQGDKTVVPEIKKASENDLSRHMRLWELRGERESLKILRASLRRRKKRFTHLDTQIALIDDALDELETAK